MRENDTALVLTPGKIAGWEKVSSPRRTPHLPDEKTKMVSSSHKWNSSLSELSHVRGGSLTESAADGGLRSFAAIGHRVNRKATERKG